MRFTVTVVPSISDTRTDVAVSVPNGTPPEKVASAIADVVRLTVDDRARLTVLIEQGIREGQVLELAPPAALGDPGSLVQLRVVGGPSAGRVQAIPSGATVVGRAPESDLTLDDPAVSRRHAIVRLSPGQVTIADLGSSNGTFLEGEPVGRTSAPLDAGAFVRIGDSTLTVGGPDIVPAKTGLREDGLRSFNRPPRLPPNRQQVRVDFPDPPQASPPARLPLLAAIVPLGLSAVVTLVLRRPEFLLFSLLAPVMMGSQWLTDRGSRRRAARVSAADFTARRAAAQIALDEALLAEQQQRRNAAPDAAALAQIALVPLNTLWERRRPDDDFLLLRLGLGDAAATGVIVTGADVGTSLRDVPLCVRLTEIGVLGLAGPISRVDGLARFLVCQAAVLHSPREQELVVLTTPERAEAWTWVRWLPHVRPNRGQNCNALIGTDPETAAARVAELNALVISRENRNDRHPAVLVVIDRARTLRDIPGMADLLRRGPNAGIYAICLDAEALSLPEECGAVATIEGATATHVTLRMAHGTGKGIADSTSMDWAEGVARALAPLRDSTPELGNEALPAEVHWPTLIEAPEEPAEFAEFLSSSWRRGPAMDVALGVGPEGRWVVDLVRDGPHALVAGRTGSGKSELLRTLVASLAVANSPDELSFVLIDYKGGAAFGACASLPHTNGVVTDLDVRLTERALVALNAELKRREQLFTAVGAEDLQAYRAAGHRLGRLVIIVDEFATLAEELPAFVRGLVGVAQRGRSLGVHLVLATQRPEGVVSADIRANTNLRICLAVTREVESRDVIDSPAAAHIGRSTPGRGFIRTSHAELHAFQAAHVGSPARSFEQANEPTAELSPFTLLGRPPVVDPAHLHGDRPSDLERLVEACRSVAERLGVAAAPSPWLPPLPERVVVPPLREGRAPWALQDLPTEQAQRFAEFDLHTTGNLLVVGTARSGRTTALCTVAASLARANSVEDVHLYGIDAARGLRPIADLPHCGAVVSLDDMPLLMRLLKYLTGELAHRRGLPTVARSPHLLLLIDGWEAFTNAAQQPGDDTAVEAVYRLLREGATAGIHVAITAERAGIAGRLASAIENRLILRLADRADYPAAGIPANLVPDAMPPGRGVLVEGAIETQVLLLDEDPSREAGAVAAPAAEVAGGTAPSQLPRRFTPPPERIYLNELTPAPSTLIVGVDLEDGAAVPLDLAELQTFIVTGPGRSGRSTTLALLAAQLHDAGQRPVVVAIRPSPLRDCAKGRGLPLVKDRNDRSRLHDAVDSCHVVVVDDAEQVAATPVGEALDQLIRGDQDVKWLAAGAPDDLAIAYRGFIAVMRRSRCGLLLSPHGPMDGEVVGIRLMRQPIAASGSPGRGLLAIRGSATEIQVPLLP